MVSASRLSGRPARDHRRVLDAIFWIACTGAPWRDLPAELGNRHSAPAPWLECGPIRRSRCTARPVRRRGGRTGLRPGLPAGGGVGRPRSRRGTIPSRSRPDSGTASRPRASLIPGPDATGRPCRLGGMVRRVKPHRTARMDARGCTGPGRARPGLQPGHARSFVHARAHLHEEGSLPLDTPGADRGHDHGGRPRLPPRCIRPRGGRWRSAATPR